MDFMKFIVDEGLILIAALYILGEFIEHTDFLENRWIPAVLLLVSMMFTPVYLGGMTPYNMVQSVLIAGATVFGDQLWKQFTKGEDK